MFYNNDLYTYMNGFINTQDLERRPAMKFKNGENVVARNYKKRMRKGQILMVVDERKRKMNGKYCIKVRNDEGNEFWVPTSYLRKLKIRNR